MLTHQEASPRVVVTGYGIHSSVALLGAAFAMHERGDLGVVWQELKDSADSLRCVGAACSTEPPTPYVLQRKWLKYMSLSTQMSVWAAGHALKHAGLWQPDNDSDAARESMGLMLATGPISFELTDVLPGLLASRGPNSELDFAALGTAGLRSSSPMMPFHSLRNMPIGLISMTFGMKGHNGIFYPDAEQSLFAFSAAVRAIKNGRMSSALVGGTAQLLSWMPFVSYLRRGYLASAPETAIPFLPSHHGFALGDAAAMLVLESENHARARGARIIAALEVEPTSLTSAELRRNTKLSDKKPDLTLVTGTQTVAQDADAIELSGGMPCVSLDSVTGYTGAACVALNVAAACSLFEDPESFRNGRLWNGNGVTVLSANPPGQKDQWGRLRLETVS